MTHIQYRGSRDELNERLAKLDGIADRLGALYQLVGRFDGALTGGHAETWRDAMDEIVRLTQDVETIGGRKAASQS